MSCSSCRNSLRFPERLRCDGIGGIEKPVDVSLIDHPVPGDWVIVHVGFALNRIDAKEAEETLRILESAGELREGMTITSGGARP